MKKLLLLLPCLFIITACGDNKDDKFKETYITQCESAGGNQLPAGYCDCSYTELTKTYSVSDLEGLSTEKDQAKLTQFMQDVANAAKICLNK